MMEAAKKVEVFTTRLISSLVVCVAYSILVGVGGSASAEESCGSLDQDSKRAKINAEAKAFWSVTLYDSKNGWFIPNDRRKDSVGENAGFELDEDGGIEIHIAAERPDGVPEENWLPIIRRDEALDLVMRIYAPDLERLKIWTAPTAEKLTAGAG